MSELAPGSHTDAVVKAIIAIARSLQMRVVAEGVETERQRELLTALGVDAIQGFLISRPLPATDATRLMSVPDTADQPTRPPRPHHHAELSDRLNTPPGPPPASGRWTSGRGPSGWSTSPSGR